MFAQLVQWLSWLALPVGIYCAIDSWWLRPRRIITAGSADAPDPPLVAALYYALPVLALAVVLRLLSAEMLDFSVVLFSIALVTGLIWSLDILFFRDRRARAAAAVGKQLSDFPEPGTIDYARSFFPVAVIVLLARAFIFEPFRIPSDSMMPTLLDGDFIVVNKFAYGLRLPVINRKIVEIGEPQRGDVIVFRLPTDPRINYIKRLVGLPGDTVRISNDRLYIDGEAVDYHEIGRYNDGCYANMRLAVEQLGEHRHETLSCRTPAQGLASLRLPGCDRNQPYSWICDESHMNDGADSGDRVLEVPAGHYLMIGDNRDNSEDGRYWGFVPEANLVGKATRIWFNFDVKRSKWFNWSRIGTKIE
ncbi:MAG: signal peptidase I [Steroidobacteraceae bacterium]